MIECCDIQQRPRSDGSKGQRAHSGARNFVAGVMAEESVLRHYQNAGCELLENRWRGASGEVDLILRDGDCVIFVEVKKARDHDTAAARISRRQMDRICMAAVEFVDGMSTGQMTEMRFDAALVDAFGRVAIIEDAFGYN